MNIVTNIEQLRKPTRLLRVRDERVDHIAEVLFREMQEHNGQGMAANQCGYDVRMFVMVREKRAPICIVSPEITRTKGSGKSNEACLSLPGVVVRVKRPLKVWIRGFDQFWSGVDYKFEGIEARRACHEIDHLEGRLIIDYRKETTGG